MKFCTHCTIPDKCDECEEGYALDAEECTTRTPSDSGEDNIVIFGKTKSLHPSFHLKFVNSFL